MLEGIVDVELDVVHFSSQLLYGWVKLSYQWWSRRFEGMDGKWRATS